ncbi:MAG: DUF418 domain-containing protein [Actinobacteria bacterium]|nr:DUF418 domain-containing protein [Actinomycetota bacterium]MCB9388276.1 DUF418 domain-containing protein [Acidimicrobiia bacterium]
MARYAHHNSAISNRNRVLGLDVARAVAVTGMVMVHLVEPVHPVAHEPWIVTAILSSPHGRALMLFLAVSGATVSVISRSSQRPLCEQRSWLLTRGLILFVIGAIVRAFFPSEVLTAYLGYMVIAALCVTLSRRWLLVLGMAMVVVGPTAIWFAEALWPAMRSPELAGHSVFSWSWVTETLAFGPYALVRGAGVFTIGMGLGRGPLRDVGSLGRILAVAACIGAVTLVGQELLESRPYDGVDFADVAAAAQVGRGSGPVPDHVVIETVTPTAQLSVAGHSGTIGSVIFGSAIAVCILCALLIISDRASRLVRWIQPLGRIALTTYVVQAVWVGLVPDEWRAMPTLGVFEIAAFIAVMNLFGMLWGQRFGIGPIETMTKAFSDLTSPVLAHLTCRGCLRDRTGQISQDSGRSARPRGVAVASEN